MDMKVCSLSNEFKVTAEIYHHNANNIPITYKQLCESLQSELDKIEISKCLNVLFDWGIVTSEYREISPGIAGKLLMVHNASKPIIADLYEKYWKDYRLRNKADE